MIQDASLFSFIFLNDYILIILIYNNILLLYNPNIEYHKPIMLFDDIAWIKHLFII